MSQIEPSKGLKCDEVIFLEKATKHAITASWQTSSAHLSSTIVAAADNSLILCDFPAF